MPPVTLQDLTADNQRRNQLNQQPSGVETAILDAAKAMIVFMDGKTTKTEIVNQLKSLNIPDIAAVAKAIKDLQTSSEARQSDITELTKTLKALLQKQEEKVVTPVSINFANGISHAGQYQAGKKYGVGQGVMYKGGFFTPLRDTTKAPDTPDWHVVAEKGSTGLTGPKGDRGDQGLPGTRGKPGLTGKPGKDGQDGLHGLQGPQGEKGDKGDKGDKGAQGDTGRAGHGYRGVPGPGVAPAGTTGQVLSKNSNDDYDTKWVDQSAGGGGGAGHTIENSSTPLAAETNLNFTSGLKASDDSGNSATKVEVDGPNVPTLNQNTTGSAAKLTTARNIDGQAFDGSASIAVIAPGTHAATSKTTPVDADELPLVDSAASNVLKKLTWANFKATLKTYFDGIYQVVGAYITASSTDILTNKDLTSGTNTFPTLNQDTTGTASKATNLKGGNNTTLLGEIPYQSNTDATTLLTPNTTTTKKFLRQTGDGTNGAAPAWDTIIAGDVPTLNQNTTGSAAKWTNARNLAGNSVDGSADVAFANKFIVQGTADSGLSAAQFLGSLSTGILKVTTSTGVLTSVGTTGSGSVVLAAAPAITGAATADEINYNNNAITASGNAATVPVTFRLSTVTNNSAATLTITITTTAAVDGQLLLVRILDATGVAQTIAWVNTENSTFTVPTTSNGSTTLPLTVGFMYNNATSKWRCVAAS